MTYRPVICSLLWGVSSSLVCAQSFPDRPIRIVVPYVPGGSTDLLSRLLGDTASETLGQNVIVENRPGAGGMLGTTLVAKAPPDGHTMMMAYSSHATNPIFIKKLPYDTLKDFSGVAHVGDIPLLLVVHPAVPAQSARELIAL
ncbi:MAG TPA: tripartite tricarboxylate transporter substrate-binding protein, partial [Burkholderiales bacterium]|nr:tripartite tricarboxylate transporter substrate-binding protein [Burkholderiales bacterium]